MENFELQPYLALINDVLQSAIIIFGASIVLYNLPYTLRDRVTRAFTTLVALVILVYTAELLVTQAIAPDSVELWLRAEWIGIALVPAALFHLSDAILTTTGDAGRRRRFLVRIFYVVSLVFMVLALFTDFMAQGVVFLPGTPHLGAGPLLPVFTLYFAGMVLLSTWNVWRARKRALIKITRRRLTLTLASVLAAPLGVFPYLLVASNGSEEPLNNWFWFLLITGNLLVGFLFGLLTLQLVYFATSSSPERVVRVRLYKYLARVPLAATFVLTAYIFVIRASDFLGLRPETAAAFAIVATIILVEWAIHTFKRPLERIFQLNNSDVHQIQTLSERLITPSEMEEFLEGLLITTCNLLQTPTAFVVALTPDGPQLEKVVGPLEDPTLNETQALTDLIQSGPPNGEEIFRWQGFWLRPLYGDDQAEMLGLFGIRATDTQLDDDDQVILNRLVNQAEKALEDRLLQQQVFAAVEGLLPQITALQQRRVAGTYGDNPGLETDSSIMADEDFSSLVKDALSHYWGGPKLAQSPLLELNIVQTELDEQNGNAVKAMRTVLEQAIEQQRPEGIRSWTNPEWILYNILELKFVEGRKVRDVARRLAMSESDLYRKQRVAIENVAQTIFEMERDQHSVNGV